MTMSGRSMDFPHILFFPKHLDPWKEGQTALRNRRREPNFPFPKGAPLIKEDAGAIPFPFSLHLSFSLFFMQVLLFSFLLVKSIWRGRHRKYISISAFHWQLVWSRPISHCVELTMPAFKPLFIFYRTRNDIQTNHIICHSFSQPFLLVFNSIGRANKKVTSAALRFPIFQL